MYNYPEIKRVVKSKYLGVQTESYLKLDSYLNYLGNKLS